jgi:hypothetical protein
MGAIPARGACMKAAHYWTSVRPGRHWRRSLWHPPGMHGQLMETEFTRIAVSVTGLQTYDYRFEYQKESTVAAAPLVCTLVGPHCVTSLQVACECVAGDSAQVAVRLARKDAADASIN